MRIIKKSPILYWMALISGQYDHGGHSVCITCMLPGYVQPVLRGSKCVLLKNNTVPNMGIEPRTSQVGV